MSREKQIEEMAECCPYFWNGACTVDAANPTDCDLMCEMFGFMTSLANAGYRKQREWISVEDRLPAKNRNYIVSCNDEYGDIWCENDVVVVAEYYRGSWTWYDNGSEYTLDNIVTHWMPLPEAPKMKGGE